MGVALRESGMGWGEQLHFWLLVPLACAVCGVHVYFAWWMTMKTGAALAAVDVERVTASAHACTPSDREAWLRDVARPAANLSTLRRFGYIITDDSWRSLLPMER